MLDKFYEVNNQNYDDGILWGAQMLEYAEMSGNRQLIGRSYLSIGMSSYMRGLYPVCLKNYQLALEIFEISKDQNYIGRTCNEFSVYWRKQKQYDKALEYLDRSLKVCAECKDSGCVETSLNNRAVIYEMTGRYREAIYFYSRAEEIALASENLTGLAYIYTDGAECYRLMGNLDSSMIQINRSIHIMTDLNNMQGLAMNLINKAALYVEQKQYEKGVETYLECISLAEQLKYTDLLKNAHYQLGKTFALKKDFENSFIHIERSHFLRDSLLNEEKMKALSEMEVKYETEKIENNLLAEQQDHIKTELKLANRNKWLVGSGGFFTATFFLALYLYQRKSRIAQAEKDSAIIVEREKGIQAVIDATEDERKRIARDLHDGIGQQMSGLKLAWQNLSNKTTNLSSEEKNKIADLSIILDSASTELRNISHRMMPKVLESFGLVPAVEEMLEKTFKHSLLKYQFEHYNLENRLPKKMELAIFRIIQELIANVIKHANANFISVQLFKNNNQMILMVEDNGKGIDETATGVGHGILNIKSRLNMFNGKLSFQPSEKSGTVATVRVPINE